MNFSEMLIGSQNANVCFKKLVKFFVKKKKTITSILHQGF